MEKGLIDHEIIRLGQISGIAAAKPGLKVQKVGRTTGLTAGTVQYVDVTSSVDIGDNQEAVFEEQLMTTGISRGGDSGSIVLDAENRATGLLFAGSDSYTLCNRIENVLSALNVRF
ncbi:MAG TPA: hypothetical protein EYP63_03720 [Desulfotomaculum sp.]|nr:hypothetical protein [Desulfotomaculum sp.]